MFVRRIFSHFPRAFCCFFFSFRCILKPMINSNYYHDNPDLQRHFDTFIDWDEAVEHYEGGFRDAKTYEENGDERLAYAPRSVEEAVEYYKQILEGYGDLMGTEISQIAQDMDREGLKFESGKVTHPAPFVEQFVKFHEAGLHALAFQRKYAGLGLPHVMKALAFEIAYRADTSFAIAAGSVNLAAIMEMYASDEMNKEWLPKLIENKYSVTMGLSEPDFGSDLPGVRTKAEKIDGQWFITGTKRYQTMACGVNEYPGASLVLARTGDANSGARGLSFFLVEGKHIEITGIEKKLGLKASATCEVAYEKAPAHLIGEEGHGLSKYVIGMLNGARLSVGSQVRAWLPRPFTRRASTPRSASSSAGPSSRFRPWRRCCAAWNARSPACVVSWSRRR